MYKLKRVLVHQLLGFSTDEPIIVQIDWPVNSFIVNFL